MDINQAYDILRVSPDTSDEEVKRAHYMACSLYHPDKGGNKEIFAKFQLAYKTIIKYRRTGHSFNQASAPSEFQSLRSRSREPLSKDKFRFDPDQFRRKTVDGQKFDRDKFNQKFRSQRPGDDDGLDFTYGVDDSGEHERDKSKYERQQSVITAQAENITPMFGKRAFDNETFQKVFMHHKKQHKSRGGEMEEYSEPKPLAASGLIECTDVKNPKHSANVITSGAADFTEAYNMPSNPNKYGKKYLEEMKHRPDVTTESSLSNAEIKKRLRKYHDAADRFKHNKEKLLTDRNTALLDIGGHDSSKARESLREQQMNLYRQEQRNRDGHRDRDEPNLEDDYSRMLQLRQPILPPMDPKALLARPQPVDRPAIRDAQPGYTPISPALLQPRTQEQYQQLHNVQNVQNVQNAHNVQNAQNQRQQLQQLQQLQQMQQIQQLQKTHKVRKAQKEHREPKAENTADRELRKLKKKLKDQERTIRKIQKQRGESNW